MFVSLEVFLLFRWRGIRMSGNSFPFVRSFATPFTDCRPLFPFSCCVAHYKWQPPVTHTCATEVSGGGGVNPHTDTQKESHTDRHTCRMACHTYMAISVVLLSLSCTKKLSSLLNFTLPYSTLRVGLLAKAPFNTQLSPFSSLNPPTPRLSHWKVHKTMSLLNC